jgi:carbon-monoxide dehydrogenase medium subunit
MIPPQFEYFRPVSLDDALRLLADNEGEAKILAGGYSLLPLMKYRLAQPGLLIDIGRVPGLDGISEVDGEYRIGARATHAAIASCAAAAAYDVVREAAAGIGDPQIRNWGTIGGSCAHADPASDWPAVILALRGRFVLRSVDGERIVWARGHAGEADVRLGPAGARPAHPSGGGQPGSAGGFFKDVFTTDIEANEVLTEVRIPTPAARTGSAYLKLERRAGDFATVGVAAVVSLAEEGRIGTVGIGLTSVADAPFAAERAEEAIRGAHPSDEMFREAGLAAAREARPAEDRRGPVDYKLAMVREMTERALRLASTRAAANA